MKLTDALKQSFPNAYEWQRRKESRKIKAAIIAGRQIGKTNKVRAKMENE